VVGVAVEAAARTAGTAGNDPAGGADGLVADAKD